MFFYTNKFLYLQKQHHKIIMSFIKYKASIPKVHEYASIDTKPHSDLCQGHIKYYRP